MEQTPNPPEFSGPQAPQYPGGGEKQRHGCVTAWLIIMIIANAGTALMYLFASDTIARALPGNVSDSMFYLLAFIGVMNVVFAVMLFQWKRWGFYGFIGTALAGFIINMNLGLPIVQCLLGLVGIGVLFGILQIRKNDVSAWDQMD